MSTVWAKVTIGLAVLLCCTSSTLAENLSVNNASISVVLNTDDGILSVTDKRTQHTWLQKAPVRGKVTDAARNADGIDFTWRQFGLDMDVQVKLRLEKEHPEFTLKLFAEGNLKRTPSYPHPFITKPGTYLVIPMNEGISYPVDDESIQTRRLSAYRGHDICMAFWGVTDGQQGHMAIIETPDDAAIHINRIDGKLCVAQKWDSQKGAFGYERKLRYVFLDKGGHVAMCKRYRKHAKQAGLLKRLSQKWKENPKVDLLIGAVNVWCWNDGAKGGRNVEEKAVEIVKEMQAAGIQRILWSNRNPPEAIKAMNAMDGVLTSRYDNYQDLIDPKILPCVMRPRPHWVQAGWPDDIMLDPNGEPRKGWRVRGMDGQMYPCGVLCDKQALKHARDRVPAELEMHPYRCRFIDTTTASPWRECYHPDHLMTRSDSRHWKMELLRYISEDMKLVTGSETGHDAAVPYVHYFEGMLSLVPYRVPAAGRNMSKIWDEVPERVAKFQLGHKYRLPLWELVYHDCVIAQWYWGDYNNKLPSLWNKRDLFNILYGTPPMFMFTRQVWEQYKDRFVQSYKKVCPIIRTVGYSEMTDHRFLTTDRDVQQTVFANGITITVNFSDKPYQAPDGKTIAPMSYHVSGIKNSIDK